jgi:hypothetical protein
MAILFDVLGINWSILRLEFLSGFVALIFPFYKMLFMNGLVSGVFLKGFLKPEKRMVFFKIHQ